MGLERIFLHEPVPATVPVGSAVFSYEQLRGAKQAGVDPTFLHLCLSDAEFCTVFGVSKYVFGKLSARKQAAPKKEKGLF